MENKELAEKVIAQIMVLNAFIQNDSMPPEEVVKLARLAYNLSVLTIKQTTAGAE